ncbi:MAG: SH3 domain-containing protein [Fibrobacteria bacterium]
MQKLLLCLGLLGAPQAIHAYASMPDNPIAFNNCTAKVKVDAARLRTAPSLDAKVMGVRVQDESLHVTKVYGKWAQVALAEGGTAYIAAYLLAFPAGSEILEQWKRESPPATVGKKAKVKWARVNFRKYPSAHAPRLGHFNGRDEVAVLADLGNGWSLVESREAGVLGKESNGDPHCFGFIANAALAAPDVPDPPGWSTPLAQVRLNPGEKRAQEQAVESPSEYCRRTAWTPELFVLELKDKARSHPDPLSAAPEQLIAFQ